MDGLNKTNCGFADICSLDASKCADCKVDEQTSTLHKILIGAYQVEELLRMQQREEASHADRH